MTSSPPSNVSNNLSIPPSTDSPTLYSYQDDEISLIDLWLVLHKWRRVGLTVFVSVFLIGVLYLLIVPKKYDYTTSIEIGTRLLSTQIGPGVVKDEILPIEDPNTLLAKLTESYIPQVLQKFQLANPGMGYCDINVRIPKGSVIVVLEGKARESAADTCINLQSLVVTKVQSEHEQINKVLKNGVTVKQNIAKNKLEELKDSSKLLNRQEARYNDLLSLLKRQLIEVNTLLQLSSENRQRAVTEAKDEAKAMTLLLLDAEVKSLIGRQSSLEERIRVDVANKLDELGKAYLDNTRTQLEQKDRISQLNFSLLNIRDTRAIVPPMQSIQPVGISGKSILMLSLVVGGILAIFSMFVAEFLGKVKEKMASNRQLGPIT